MLLALTQWSSQRIARCHHARARAHTHMQPGGLEQEMNVWGGCDRLQILLGTAERRERWGAAGSSRASREGYISGMGIHKSLALRLPIVGAPPFAVAQCVLRSVHTNQRPNEIRSEQSSDSSGIATCHLPAMGAQRGVAPAADLLQCNATPMTDNERTFRVNYTVGP